MYQMSITSPACVCVRVCERIDLPVVFPVLARAPSSSCRVLTAAPHYGHEHDQFVIAKLYSRVSAFLCHMKLFCNGFNEQSLRG